jgi:CRP-like cAMP-binding protein
MIESILDLLNTKQHLTKAAMVELSLLVREIELQKGEIIQKTGSTCKTIYFVKEGIARIFYYQDGDDITEYFAFSGDVIIRAESLFTGQSTHKGIESLSKTVVYAIDSFELEKLYDKYHEIERLFRIVYQNAFVRYVRRTESLQLKTARERYEDLVNTTDIVSQIALKHIASYLGITQVSLSRIRSEKR